MIGGLARFRIGVAAIIVAAAMAFCGSATPAQTTAPSTEPSAVLPTSRPTTQVSALIDDLTSDSYETRQAATKKLVEMGDAVEPQLHEALKGDLTDEARARITAALRGIQEHRDFGPSVITLHYKNAPLPTVLNDFATQAGADLGVRRPEIAGFIGNRYVSVDLDHVNFWTALDTVGQISNLRPQPYNGETRMLLGMNGGGMMMSSDKSVISGPFIIVPQTSSRTVSYYNGGGQRSSTLSLQLMAMAEPKLHIIGNHNQDWLKECLDEKGHSLLIGGQQPMYSNQSRWWWQLYANLGQPAGIGNKIASLKGELKFTIQTKSDVIAINNLMQVRNLTKTVGNNTLTIQRCESDGAQYQLHLAVANMAISNNNNPWQAMQDVLASIEILDRDDQPLRQQNVSYNMPGGKIEAQVGYLPTTSSGRVTGPPATLRWEAATETENRTVPFELHDLDLPNPP
jgi:hypothetical protein